MNARILLLSVAIAGASAASAQSSTILYLPGKKAADQNIGFRNWGSGTIHESQDIGYEGTTSIAVSTRNLFQGGIMMYANPIDLTPAFGDRNNLLRITFRPADSSMVFGGGGGPSTGGRPGTDGGGGGLALGAGGLQPGGAGGQGGPTRGQDGRGGGGLGTLGTQGSGATGAKPTTGPALKQLRMIVTTSDGKKSEVYIPVASSAAGDRGWRMVSIPLQAIRGFDQTNKSVKEVAFSADSTTTFYIGDMRVVNDSTKITGEIVQHGPINLALSDELNLSAYGFGGSSPLKFQWDFDSSDGIQVDAEGQSVKRKFRKAGKYTITLTVVDQYGLKAPATSTLQVTVNP